MERLIMAAPQGGDTTQDDPFDLFSPGQVYRGTVTEITNFGVFVNVADTTGIITIPNLSWKRINDPSEVVQEGDTVSVMVLSVDSERRQISLSLKELTSDPLREFARTSLGRLVSGRITKVTPIGYFVEVEPGLEGLLPESEATAAHLDPVTTKVGDSLQVKVHSVDIHKRRIELSLTDTA
jgi:small subunit ribosomal protein S1